MDDIDEMLEGGAEQEAPAAESPAPAKKAKKAAPKKEKAAAPKKGGKAPAPKKEKAPAKKAPAEKKAPAKKAAAPAEKKAPAKKAAAEAPKEKRPRGGIVGQRLPHTQEVASHIRDAVKRRKNGIQCVEVAKHFSRTGLSVLRIAESLVRQNALRIEKVDGRLTFFKPE